MSKREECLDEAKECICGQREQDYGKPEDNFAKIATLWNAYLNTNSVIQVTEEGVITGKSEYGITSTDVAIMMALLKIARIASGGGSKDSFVDLAGYAACGYEIWSDKLSHVLPTKLLKE